ncbi:P-loop containing nucleoside triphosphate hydrolase protein [Trichoderma evansii]
MNTSLRIYLKLISLLLLIVLRIFESRMRDKIMSHDRTISSNAFESGAQIHQGDTVIHNYNSDALPKARRVIPFNRNEDVVHRPKIVDQLNMLLSPAREGECCNAALWGLGGSGKTQIALDYAYRRSRDDPACAIFWVHADNDATFERDYRTIARKLGLDNKLGSEELLFKVCDSIESQPRWLLILDNADDLALFGVGDTLDQAKSLVKYLPQGPGGSVLWTSRDKQIVALVGPRRGVQVTHMSAEEAKRLLTVTRDENIRNNEIQDAQLLLKELQWLPLAISQAGLYMRRTATPIEEYLSKLLKKKSRWDTLKHTEHDRYRRPGVPNSILETWDISIKCIEQENKTAYNILHTIAYLDNQNIPLSMMLAIFTTKIDFLQQQMLCEENKDTFDTAIIRLKEFSLINERKTEDEEPSFDIHKLTHEAIRYRLNQQDIYFKAQFLSIAASAIRDLFAGSQRQETWHLCEKYEAHAIRVSDWAEASEAELHVNGIKTCHFVSFCLKRVIRYFYNRGQWRKTVLLKERALNLKNKTLGENYPDNIVYTCSIALIYLRQGLYNEGEKFVLRALIFSEKVYGEKDPLTLTMMSCLVTVYYCRGQFKDAEKLQMKVLSMLHGSHGEKYLRIIEAMRLLGYIYDRQHLFDRALKLKAKTLALCYEVLGEKNRVTLDVRQSIALTYIEKEEYNKAEKLQAQIISLWREFHGAALADLPTAMAHLSRIYQGQGRYDESRKLRARIFWRQHEVYGKKHPKTIEAMMHLALAYCLEGRLILANGLGAKALSLFHEVLGEEHFQTIFAKRDAAFICHRSGLLKMAGKLEKKSSIFGAGDLWWDVSTQALNRR